MQHEARDWPAFSPAAINAWLLFVTTKPPTWQDSLMSWTDHAPTVGTANEGFYYPDPLGFWSEIRRWALELFRLQQRQFSQPDALALTSLIHVSEDPAAFARAVDVCQPHVVLFLDEPSWALSKLEVDRVAHFIRDPHRRGQVYEGFWGRTADGRVVGKAPQHPTTHNLYRERDMLDFLRSAPLQPAAPKVS
ncbi:MAG: hypothetical protein M3179_11735 [Actinomycetota bacterium]|nr:hypothetical protein [Actinomycetota bacterium]